MNTLLKRTGIVMATFLCVAACGIAAAGVITWDGKTDPANSGKWSDPANWDTDKLPGPGDTVVIPSTAVKRIITVDVPVSIARLDWNQTQGEELNYLTLEKDLTSAEVTFPGVGFAIGRTHLMTIPKGVKFTTASQDRPSMWPIGDGTIVKDGTGNWVNSYLHPGPPFGGSWVVNGGVVTAANWEGRMFNSKRITVNAGATMAILDGGATPQAYTVNGTGYQGQGALRFINTTVSARAITLATDSDVAVDATLMGTLKGAIDGPGGLRKIGPGTLVIAGPSNTYAGTTTVMEGKLVVQRPIAGLAVVQSGAILEGAPRFFPRNASGKPDVTVQPGGQWITGANSWWGNGNPTVSGNWSDPNNWTLGYAPGVGIHAEEDAVIGSTAVGRTITVDVPVKLGMLTWQQGDGPNLNRVALEKDLACADAKFIGGEGAAPTHLLTIREGVKFNTTAAEELPKKIEELTGGRTKIVWEGNPHLPGGTMPNPKGDPALIGYDTADGKSRVLSTSSGWMLPFITPDGSAVIFNMGNPDGGSKGSKIVNWDGSNERWLVEGEYGWAHCAWVDPATQITWVYVSDAAQRGWGVDKSAFTKVFRVRLDKPDVREPIYETNRGGLWLFATPDGKRLWGSIRDSQEQAMLDIATKTVTPITGGCDPSHSPTEDRFWAFTGTHRHMIMYDWKDGQAANQRSIQANTMPGVDGRENVWHPRWSTHPRIFTIMGPEHGKAQIYLGRFNKEVTAIEAWVQITNNGQWNGWSHAWVQTDPEKPALPVKPETTPAASTHAPAAQRPSWPAERRELVFALRNGNEIANPPVAFDADGKPVKDIVLKHTLWRHYGPNHELILSGSPADVSGAAAYVVARAVQSRAMTLLAGVTPGVLEDKRPRRLLALMDGETALLSVIQAGNQISLEIGGPWAGGKATICPLPVLRERWPFALAATIKDGTVTLYGGGKSLGVHRVPWAPARAAAPRLVLGDTARQVRAGAPALEAVALYARDLAAAEIAAESKRWNAERAARPAIPRLRLKGKLLRMAATPDVAKLGPYTQALVVGEYEVTGVVQGEYKEKTVNVAHWGLLDRKPQPVAARKAGETFDLLIEPFEKHPQLEPEYLADTDRELGGALYYDVEN